MEETYKLSASTQERLDSFYNKHKKKCVFGLYPKERAYETILYYALEYLEARMEKKGEL